MYPLPLLRKFLAKEGETFVSQESLTKTTFGKYKVTANLFNASGYNEYLQKLLRVVTLRFETVVARVSRPFRSMGHKRCR